MALLALIATGLKHISVLVSALCGLTSAKKKLERDRKQKLQQAYVHNHKSIASVYPILHTSQNKFPEVDRVSVFMSHNGNGIPQPGTPSYTTCIQEVTSYRTTPIIERWQKIPSDQEMIGIIGEMIENGICSIEVPEDPVGILSDYCVGNGIKGVVAIPISVTKSGFLFLNFCSATTSDLTEVDGLEFEAKSTAARVAELYRENG